MRRIVLSLCAALVVCVSIDVVYGQESGDNQGVSSTAADDKADTSSYENYFMSALIKSISGSIPKDEFFDLRFRFKGLGSFFTLGALDAALTSDSGGPSQFTDGGFSLNWAFTKYKRLANPRVMYAGFVFRVFDAVPYSGLNMGGQELGGSRLRGSMISAAYLLPVRGSWMDASASFLLDFYLSSGNEADIINKLNLRGSLLIPTDRNRDLKSRIVIEVPIGKIVNIN